MLFLEVDANQWHGKTPEGEQVELKYMMDNLYQAGSDEMQLFIVGASLLAIAVFQSL
ncbi:hypothetical protein D3C84_1275100 [compost metagenome]